MTHLVKLTTQRAQDVFFAGFRCRRRMCDVCCQYVKGADRNINGFCFCQLMGSVVCMNTQHRTQAMLIYKALQNTVQPWTKRRKFVFNFSSRQMFFFFKKTFLMNISTCLDVCSLSCVSLHEQVKSFKSVITGRFSKT